MYEKLKNLCLSCCCVPKYYYDALTHTSVVNIYYGANYAIAYQFDGYLPKDEDGEKFLKKVQEELDILSNRGMIDILWFNRYFKRG